MRLNLFLIASILSLLAAFGLLLILSSRIKKQSKYYFIFALFSFIGLAAQLSAVILPVPSNIQLILFRTAVSCMSFVNMSVSLILLSHTRRGIPKFLPYLFYSISLFMAGMLFFSNKFVAGITDTTTPTVPLIFGEWTWLMAGIQVFPLLFALPSLIADWVSNQLPRTKGIVIFFGIILPALALQFGVFILPVLGYPGQRITPLSLIVIVSIYFLALSNPSKIVPELSIRKRIFWSFVLYSVAAIFLADVMLYYFLPRALVNYELGHLKNFNQRQISDYKYTLNNLVDFVEPASSKLYFDPTLVATSSSTMDLESLGTNLSTYLRYTENTELVYLVDLGGKEVLRVSKLDNETRKVFLSGNNLSAEPAVVGARELGRGEVYISRPRLRRDPETDKLIEPHVPEITVSTPIYDSKENRSGTMVVSATSHHFLPTGYNGGEGYKLAIVDPQGFFLHSEDKTEEFGSSNDLNTAITLKAKDPNLEQQVRNNQGDGFVYKNNLFAVENFNLSSDQHNNYLTFISYGSSDDLRVIYVDLIRLILLIELVSIVVVVIIASIQANSISYPIEQLTKKIREIDSGRLDLNVATNANDEVGELSRSTQKLMAKLNEEKETIAQQVELRTSQLSHQVIETERSKKALINVLQDLSQEKQSSLGLAADLKKFQLAVENASDHIIITDPEGFILYANQAAENVTGFNRREILGSKAGALWGKRMPKEFYQAMWKTIKIDKKTFSSRISNKRKNGQEYLADSSITPVLDNKGEVSFFVGIERDVTKAVEVDRMKTEFISLASHQMRTPLSAMRWFCELLLDGTAGELTPEQKGYVLNISNSNERLIELVNSLLDISRIESGRLTIEPEPTDLGQLVTQAIEELEEQIKLKNLQVVTDIQPNLPQISIDPKLVAQVYINLISNAVKYTPEGGKILVSIIEKPQTIESMISDTGIGIPKTQIHRVFERFFRGDNVIKTSPAGTGLGLYLAKAVVVASGGDIWFESVENEGTKFRFSLPKSGSVPRAGEVTLTGSE